MIKKYIKGEPIMRNKVFEDNLVFIRSKIKERVCQYDTTTTKNPMNLGQNIEHIQKIRNPYSEAEFKRLMYGDWDAPDNRVFKQQLMGEWYHEEDDV